MDGAHSADVSFGTPLKPPAPPRRRLPAPLRAGKVVVYAVVALALSYWITANAFLAFGTPLLFAGTDQVNATFRRAWTVYPGTIHVRDLRVVFQDHNVQFEIGLPTAEMDLRLTELASQTLHATRVRGEGVRFLMRHRIQPEAKHEAWVGALPKIEGFADPPLFEARVPSPPIPDDQYNLWTIHLEDVDVRVTEIWAQFVRYRGAAVAKGAFRLRPARHLWVGPASLTVESGRLDIGSQPLAGAFSGKIDCTVHPFDVRIPVGNAVFRYISADLALRAGRFQLEPMAQFFAAEGRPSIRSVPGDVAIDARLDRGVMSETSRMRMTMPEVSVERDRWIATAKGVATTFEGSKGPGAELRTQWSGGELKIRDGKAPPLTTGTVEGFLTTSSRDTTAAWHMIRAAGEVKRLAVDDLRWLNDASPRVGARLGGALTLDGKARYEADVLDADASVRLVRARARSGELVMGLDGSLDMQLVKARLDEHSGRLIARLRGKSAGVDASSADVSAENLALDADVYSQGGRARGFVEGTLGKLLAKLEALDFAGDGRVKVVLDDLDTRSLAARGEAVLALSKVSARNPTGDVEAQRFDLKSSFDRSRRGVWNARVESDIAGFSGRTKTLSFAAEPQITGSVSEYDPELETGFIEGKLRIRDFRAAGRDQSASCPVLRVPETRLETRVDLGRDGKRGLVEAKIRGARFVWDDFRTSFGSDVTARFEPRPGSNASKVNFRVQAREVRLASGAGGAAGWDANVPELAVSGTVDVERKIRGAVRIEAARAESRIGRSRIETQVSAALGLDSVDIAGRQGRFDGAVRLTNATVRAGDQSVEGWWAAVEIGSALVTAGNNLDVSSLFKAQLRDATPGLVALSAEDALPSWLVSVLPLRELSVKGSVNRRCRLTDIHFTEAQGGPLEGSGRLQSVSDAVRGAFLVRLADLGVLSAGIGFEPESTRVKLLAGYSWLESRQGELDASVRELLEKPCAPAPSECTAD